MSQQTNEHAFEMHVEEVLLGSSGWASDTNAEWDGERALFPAQVGAFLEATQPKLQGRHEVARPQADAADGEGGARQTAEADNRLRLGATSFQ